MAGITKITRCLLQAGESFDTAVKEMEISHEQDLVKLAKIEDDLAKKTIARDAADQLVQQRLEAAKESDDEEDRAIKEGEESAQNHLPPTDRVLAVGGACSKKRGVGC